MGNKQTQRERESAAASRAKAQRKRRAERSHTLKRALTAFALLVLVGIGIAWHSGIFGRAYTAALAHIDSASVNAGFALNTIYLDGRARTPKAEVDKALALPNGTPMLTLSLASVRERLEALPTVKAAAVERELPSTLHIKLTEREPVAIWQFKGKLALLDDTGAVMPDLDVANYKHLPLMVGEGVPMHIKGALDLLAANAQVAARVSHMRLIGQRRWDIGLQNGITLKLPEADALLALQEFVALNEQQQLTERAVKTVDMRDNTRLVIQKSLTPPAPKPTLAQET